MVADSPDVISDFFLDSHFHVSVQAGEIICALDKISRICQDDSLFLSPDAVGEHFYPCDSSSSRIICRSGVQRFYLAVQIIGKQHHKALLQAFPEFLLDLFHAGFRLMSHGL